MPNLDFFITPSLWLRWVYIAGICLALLGWGRGGCHGHIDEVKKLRHIHSPRVAIRKSRQTEAGFNQLQNRCVVGRSMRHVVALREWRYHD